MYNKLIFAAPFGSGKTLLMTAKSIELAEAGEDVLFLIFVDGDDNPTERKTLLYFDLEEKFKKHPNIKVFMVPFIDGKTDNLKGTFILILHMLLSLFKVSKVTRILS